MREFLLIVYGIKLVIPATTATAFSTAVTTTTTVATTTTTGGALFTRTSLVDFQSAAIQLFAIKLRDRSLGIGLGRHFDKCDAAAAAREFVDQQRHGFNRTRCAEVLL